MAPLVVRTGRAGLPGDQNIDSGPMNSGVPKVCASYQPESPGKGTPDRLSNRDGGIAGADLVDESREPVGELWILELEHVLGVALARA